VTTPARAGLVTPPAATGAQGRGDTKGVLLIPISAGVP